ncbi:MAG TPA: histidine phosphatase family protein [Burkholderiaceae bacterium]|nr:histidine phosphatase family protein [Burkholderiaceae bacterium]
MTKLLAILLAAIVAGCAAPSPAPRGPDMPALVEQLRAGGYVIVMRHGATHRDQADTDPLNYDNVAKQRQLSDSGRDVARQVGDAWRKLGIPVGDVVTSRFNRAKETGRLIAGAEVVTTDDVTEGGLVVTPIENDRRADAMRRLAAAKPSAGKNTLIVSHKPNILDAFGRDWFDVKEGEASVFRPDTAGKPALVARVQASDWVKAARPN